MHLHSNNYNNNIIIGIARTSALNPKGGARWLIVHPEHGWYLILSVMNSLGMKHYLLRSDADDNH